MLNVPGDPNRRALAIEVHLPLPLARVIRSLEQIIESSLPMSPGLCQAINPAPVALRREGVRHPNQ